MDAHKCAALATMFSATSPFNWRCPKPGIHDMFLALQLPPLITVNKTIAFKIGFSHSVRALLRHGFWHKAAVIE